MYQGTLPVIQWLRLHTSSAGDMGLIPGGGTRIPLAKTKNMAWQKNKKDTSIKGTEETAPLPPKKKNRQPRNKSTHIWSVNL